MSVMEPAIRWGLPSTSRTARPRLSTQRYVPSLHCMRCSLSKCAVRPARWASSAPRTRSPAPARTRRHPPGAAPPRAPWRSPQRRPLGEIGPQVELVDGPPDHLLAGVPRGLDEGVVDVEQHAVVDRAEREDVRAHAEGLGEFLLGGPARSL